MTKYIVQGGSPLFGEVHISGAKNAAVAILPAALLVDGADILGHFPLGVFRTRLAPAC